MATQNFEMINGDSKSLVVSIKDNDGVAKDVSAASAAQYEIAERASSSTADVTKTLGAGIGIVTTTVTITIDAADTADLEGNYHHEIQITDGAGLIHTAFVGTITIKKGKV